tara:strand:- start:3667 stop:3912 length:246 start_codon:yes stop_codon:yes gene_type:complete
MKLATKLIKNRYYLRESVHGSYSIVFKALDNISEFKLLYTCQDVTVEKDGERTILFNLSRYFRSDDVYEISEDEFLLRTIK